MDYLFAFYDINSACFVSRCFFFPRVLFGVCILLFVLSLRPLSVDLPRYFFGETISVGASSTVRVATNLETGDAVAVKLIDKAALGRAVYDSVRNEVKALVCRDLCDSFARY